MDHFAYRRRVLYCEDVAIGNLIKTYGSPLYVYSQATLVHHLKSVQTAFADAKPIICYSVKANGNLSILKLMGKYGAGYDVTSQGEYFRAMKAGPASSKVVFAGVGKTDPEIKYALENGVFLFDVECEQELQRLGEIAALTGKVAPAALRINPELPPKTHAKTDTSLKGVKFGFDMDSVLPMAEKFLKNTNVKIVGIHMHLGSPILKAEPYKEGAAKGVKMIEALRKQGHDIQYINMGGGFGINYKKEEALPATAFADAILPAVKDSKCQLILEPGRFIVGNAGVLISRVIYTKETGGKTFIIQDAAMNDLIRPTLYDSFHRIWPVQPRPDVPEKPEDFEAAMPGTFQQDVVGPVCESGDFLAKGRYLPKMQRDDLLATFSTGAYGMSMASNYNARCRAAEVLVTGATHRLIRRRETAADLIAGEVDCMI
ncbi:diaminopimelate decarboxylase [soil metagenome]